MKSITPFLIVFFFPLILCSQSNLLKKYNINNKQFKFYSKLNENEKRLIEFKDEDEHLILKIALLNLINKHREKHRRKPIELDIHACRSANKTAQMSAKNEYCGHWDLEGKKPYHRYGLDGGEDHISENASATSLIVSICCINNFENSLSFWLLSGSSGSKVCSKLWMVSRIGVSGFLISCAT